MRRRKQLRRRITVLIFSPKDNAAELCVIDVPFTMSRGEVERRLEKHLRDMSEFTGETLDWVDLPDVLALIEPPIVPVSLEERAFLLKVAHES